MFGIDEYLVAKSDITDFAILDDENIVYSTKNDGINFYNFLTFQEKKEKKSQFLNQDTKFFCFSPNHKLFAFVDNQYIYIINIKKRELIQTISVASNPISKLSFDASSKYVIVVINNLQVLKYRYEQQFLISRLYPLRNVIHSFSNNKYINLFTFYKNYIALSFSDGTLEVIDMSSRVARLKIVYNRITALSFIDENNLICGDKNGGIEIISLENPNSKRVIKTTFSSIKEIIMMQNRDFAMIITDAKFVSIIDIKNLKVVIKKYIEFSSKPIKIDIADNGFLVALLQNNKISTIKLPTEEKLKSLALHNCIKEAYELVTKEPMLRNSQTFKTLEERYRKRYIEATKALEKNDTAKAKQMLEIYDDVESKKNQVKELFLAFKNYPRFKELYREEKYALIYLISDKFIQLRETTEYKKTEQIFKDTLLSAQKLLIRGEKSEAKALLSSYKAVPSKRNIVKLILAHNADFIEFLRAVNDKDYKKIDQLIASNPELREIPNFKTLSSEIEIELERIESFIKSGELSLLDSRIEALESAFGIENRVQKLKLEYINAQKLQEAYQNNNFRLCYEILDENSSLKGSVLGVLLEKHWFFIMGECEEFALSGNIKDIKSRLGELAEIKERRVKVEELIKVGFYARVSQLLEKQNFDGAEVIIYTYIDTYGYDLEIAQIMRSYESCSARKLAITQN
ncbi:WD40 repeat domain-containing protein [Sulfurimonas sp.]|uniref:WD40 repeat domain-containing protein n=1 Tax=Sulfurimonas sp. TaxID=2022749 RepID=UPI00260B3D1F|nr:WD40 repeat domain-containing protein [Sulfurimonas sp.]MDD5157693.1 WD40 repeat domain-containing protein [Sulfurimonas sp.]